MDVKYISFQGLELYHKNLMKYINKLIVNRAFEYSHCPNCGAIITGDKCEFCGTVFKKEITDES